MVGRYTGAGIKKAFEQTASSPCVKPAKRLDVLQYSCSSVFSKFRSYLTPHPKKPLGYLISIDSLIYEKL